MAARRLAESAAEPWPPYAPSPANVSLLKRSDHVRDLRLSSWYEHVQALRRKAAAKVTARGADAPPDRLLACEILDNLPTLVALCSPAKGALGVTRATPAGRLADGWTWRAAHGFGIRGRDGLITESVRLLIYRPPVGPKVRGAVFLWTRPVPDPRLVHGIAKAAWVALSPTFAAAVALLPAPRWTAALSSIYDYTGTGRLADVPVAVAQAAIKAEVLR